jgi:hypothetical protein
LIDGTLEKDFRMVEITDGGIVVLDMNWLSSLVHSNNLSVRRPPYLFKLTTTPSPPSKIPPDP